MVEGLCARGMFARRSCWRGRDAGIECMEWEWGARRGRETIEKQPQWYEKGKCRSERRCGTEGAPRRGRDAHPKREEGIRKEERETEGMGEREREAKETKEKETGDRFSGTVRSEKGTTCAVEPRRLVPELAWQGAVPTSFSPRSGAPMTASGTPISPTAMATSCDNAALGTVRL